MFKHLRSAALLTALRLPASTTTGERSASAATAPLVTAFEKHGWVFGLPSDGSILRLTAGTNAVDPVLSPDRSAVDYFSSVRRRTDRYAQPILTRVRTVGTGANRQNLVADLHGRGPGALTWSPSGRSLAYAHGREVTIWNGDGAFPMVVTRLRRSVVLGRRPVIAWSANSRRIAVPLSPASLPQPTRFLAIAVGNTTGAGARVVRVSFPTKIMGSQATAFGSQPAPNLRLFRPRDSA